MSQILNKAMLHHPHDDPQFHDCCHSWRPLWWNQAMAAVTTGDHIAGVQVYMMKVQCFCKQPATAAAAATTHPHAHPQPLLATCLLYFTLHAPPNKEWEHQSGANERLMHFKHQASYMYMNMLLLEVAAESNATHVHPQAITHFQQLCGTPLPTSSPHRDHLCDQAGVLPNVSVAANSSSSSSNCNIICL
jgi:hypothetical protein